MHALFLFGTLPIRLYYFWARASFNDREWVDDIFTFANG